MRIDRTKRRAASKVLFHGYGTLINFAHTVIDFDARDQWGGRWGNTFTPKEREYIEAVQERIRDDAEALRKLALRMEKS